MIFVFGNFQLFSCVTPVCDSFSQHHIPGKPVSSLLSLSSGTGLQAWSHHIIGDAIEIVKYILLSSL